MLAQETDVEHLLIYFGVMKSFNARCVKIIKECASLPFITNYTVIALQGPQAFEIRDEFNVCSILNMLKQHSMHVHRRQSIFFSAQNLFWVLDAEC